MSRPRDQVLVRGARSLEWLLLLASALIAALHFVHLRADPSVYVNPFHAHNWSGDLYTDEGWAASAAVNKLLGGGWHQAGGFNPAVIAPVWPLILYPAFRVFGTSIGVARALECCLFLGGALLAYVLVRRLEGRLTAAVFLLLMCCSYFGYRLGRLAMLESVWVFFLVLALVVAHSAVERLSPYRAGIAGMVLAVAILTKLTAVFGAAPALAVLLVGSHTRKKKLLLAACLTGGATLVLLPYWLTVVSHYRADYNFYLLINLKRRTKLDAAALAQQMWRVLRSLRLVGWLTFLTFVASLVAGLRRSARRKLFIVMLTWLAGDIAILSTTSYHPTRYLLSFLIPMCVVIAIGLCDIGSARRTTVAAGAVLGVLVAVNLFVIGSYLHKPRYTYDEMARAIARTARADRRTPRLMLGQFANTVSLFNGIPSLNDTLGTAPLVWRIRKYQPGYYLSLGRAPRRVAADFAHAGRRLMLLRRFNVLDNYLRKQVFCYRVVPSRSARR